MRLLSGQLKSLLSRIGFDLVRLNERVPRVRRQMLFNSQGINCVLDVGANSGIYGKEIRECGYRGKIVSFEPLPDAYEALKIVSLSDANWTTLNLALGSAEKTLPLNVSKNSWSSSFLEMSEAHLIGAPNAKYVRSVESHITRLDAIFSHIVSSQDRIHLKIDTQGYEYEVLEGAKDVLSEISTVQLELSFVPMYKNEMLALPMLEHLQKTGLEIISIEPGFADPKSGQLYQADFLFRNNCCQRK
jgi:FkbM family methyltransferase